MFDLRCKYFGNSEVSEFNDALFGEENVLKVNVLDDDYELNQMFVSSLPEFSDRDAESCDRGRA